MKKIKSMSHALSILIFLSGLSSAANCPDDEKVTGTQHARQSITGVSAKATDMLNELTNKVTSDIKKITIDTAAAEDFIRTTAEEKGYVGTVAADIVIGVINDGKAKLLVQIQEQTTIVINKLTTEAAEQINKLDPKVHFQADYSYCPGHEDENVWTRGGANKEGEFTGVAITAAANVAFKAGVSVALDVTCDFKLAVTFNGSLNLGALNPTGPLSGSGRKLVITTTPNWTRKLGGSIGVTAFLGLTVGIIVDSDGQFSDVKGELTI